MDNEKHCFHIEITNKCVLECSACERTWLKKKFFPKMRQVDEIDIDMLCNFLEGVTDTVHFEGNTGDAIYHSKLFDLIKRLKDMQIKIELTTNGSGKKESFWRTLVELLSPNDLVQFSIDGLEDTNHIYRKNSKWHTVRKALEIVGDSDVMSEWKYIVFKHNEHQVDEARAFAKSLKIDRFKLMLSDRGWTRGYDQELIPTNQSYIPDRQALRQEFLNGGSPDAMKPQCSLENGRRKMWPYISVHGDFAPCCAIGTYQNAYKTIFSPRKKSFNIKDKSIKDILLDKSVIDFYKSTKSLQTANKCCKIICGVKNG